MEAPLLVLDLETQRLANEVGGWSYIRRMGLSVAVTYDPAGDVYRTYEEHQVGRLIDDLRSARRIVGYNLLRFDYEVLRAYTDDPLDDLPTVDMMVDLHRTLGWRPKLDDLAAATLNQRKSADGLAAVRWFREGQMQKVIDYCRRDVEVTWNVYDFGCRNRHVLIYDRRRGRRRVPVLW